MIALHAKNILTQSGLAPVVFGSQCAFCRFAGNLTNAKNKSGNVFCTRLRLAIH